MLLKKENIPSFIACSIICAGVFNFLFFIGYVSLTQDNCPTRPLVLAQCEYYKLNGLITVSIKIDNNATCSTNYNLVNNDYYGVCINDFDDPCFCYVEPCNGHRTYKRTAIMCKSYEEDIRYILITIWSISNLMIGCCIILIIKIMSERYEGIINEIELRDSRVSALESAMNSSDDSSTCSVDERCPVCYGKMHVKDSIVMRCCNFVVHNNCNRLFMQSNIAINQHCINPYCKKPIEYISQTFIRFDDKCTFCLTDLNKGPVLYTGCCNYYVHCSCYHILEMNKCPICNE